MANDTNLKLENNWQLVSYVILQGLVIGWLLVGFPTTSQEIKDMALAEWAKAGAAIVAALFVRLIGALGSPNLKARLVFWRWNNPLPGSRAFTGLAELARRDSRIDRERLTERLGRLPADPTEQNNLWYRTYRSHAQEVSVLNNHLEYLLFRELTWLTAVLGIVGFLAVAISGRFLLAVLVLSSELLLFFLARFAAVATGERLIATVLACESAAVSRT